LNISDCDNQRNAVRSALRRHIKETLLKCHVGATRDTSDPDVAVDNPEAAATEEVADADGAAVAALSAGARFDGLPNADPVAVGLPLVP
jgi:hypothetical protein